jgi:hypothetical protein
MVGDELVEAVEELMELVQAWVAVGDELHEQTKDVPEGGHERWAVGQR